MIAIFEPNQQASSLYTETESLLNSHLQIQPNDDRQLLKKNASEDSDTLDFDYLTDFGGDKALIEEAKAVSKSFVSFLRRTFKDLTRLGTELWEVCNKCVDSLGKTEGKEKFNRWLSSEFNGSKYLATAAMSLSQWYSTLSPAMQRVVAKNVKKWSVSALKELSRLTDDLVTKLVTSGKQTAKTIKAAHASHIASTLTPLTGAPDRAATADDWKSVFLNSSLTGQQQNLLKKNARLLASLYDTEIGSEPVVMVKHVNQAIASYIEELEYKKSTAPASKEVEPLPDISELQQMVLAIGVLTPVAKKGTKLWKNQMMLTRPPGYEEAPFPIEFRSKKDLMHWWEAKGKAFALNHPLPEEVQQSLRQALEAQSPPVEEMYTQEQVDSAIARDRSKRKDYVYTEEDVKEKIADACKQMYTDEEVQDEIEFELRKERASLKKAADTAYAEKLASLQKELAEKDREIAALSKLQATVAPEELASLQQALAERDQKIASLEEQNAAAVASARALMEKEREAALSQARADEREKMAIAHASKLASLQKELTEKDEALASYEEEKATAVAEARADERASVQAAAVADIEVLQREIESLKAQNHSLMATREQLVTATSQVEELKSQLGETKEKYEGIVKWLEADLNTVVESNQSNGRTLKLLEEANKSMHHENRSLKEELAGYKNIETWIQSNYAKITKTESLQKQNQVLSENLEGTTQQVVSLSSQVAKYREALNEISDQQKILANKGIPGFQDQGKTYVSPLDGKTYQGIKGLAKFLQDLINNNFNLATT